MAVMEEDSARAEELARKLNGFDKRVVERQLRRALAILGEVPAESTPFYQATVTFNAVGKLQRRRQAHGRDSGRAEGSARHLGAPQVRERAVRKGTEHE